MNPSQEPTPTMRTATPRTDAAVEEYDVAFIGYDGLSSSPQELVDPDFARTLERELIAAQKERDEWKADSGISRGMLAVSDAQLAAQAQELAGLREDKERLDWLDANPGGVLHPDAVLGGIRISFGPMRKTYHGKTYRDAIDNAARQSSGRGGKE